MQRIRRVGHETPPRHGCLHAVPDRRDHAAAGFHDAGQRFYVLHQAVALQALSLQKGVEAETFRGQVGPGDGAHGAGQIPVIGKVERSKTPGAQLRHQLQRDPGLYAQRARVAAEQPGQVGTVVFEEGRPVFLGIRPGIQYGPVGQHHLQAQHGVHRAAIAPGTPEYAVLRHAAADGRLDAGQRSPVRRAVTRALQRLVQILPGTTGFHRDVHIFGVALDHPVEFAQVEQDGIRFRRHVAAGVGHAAAAGDDRMAALRCGG